MPGATIRLSAFIRCYPTEPLGKRDHTPKGSRAGKMVRLTPNTGQETGDNGISKRNSVTCYSDGTWP